MSPETNRATSLPPDVTVVIPIYNEQLILMESVIELRAGLAQLPFSFEIILAENGSTDKTIEIAESLARQFPEISMLSAGEPNYGKALKQGILLARGRYVVCDEIDICDVGFYRRALAILDEGSADLVVGSKVMKGASDDRPVGRHMATLALNLMLRVAVGFKGTDTHGLKAFRRDALLGTVGRCLVDRDMFASEFVVRAGREGIPIKEIPLQIAEKRKPSVDLMKRVPKVLGHMARLTYAIRFKG